MTAATGGLIPNIGQDISSAAAAAVLDAVRSAAVDAANWLVGHVMDLVLGTTTVNLDAAWFRKESSLMESELLLVVLPLLMAATIGPVLRQDVRRLFRVWGIGLPVAVVAGLAGAQFAGWALAATDSLCGVFLGDRSHAIATQFSDAMGSAAVAQAPVFVQIIIANVTIVGTVLVWLELMVRSSAVYVATFFMPLALAGFVWPSTAGMAKRVVEILAAAILSKFVIVASLSLGLAALGSGAGVDATVSGAGILLLAGFAPFTLLRLAPVVETAAIAHLEGLSRRPFRATANTVRTVAGAPFHPVTQLVMARAAASKSSPSPAASVDPQPIPEHPADWPLAESGCDD
ncbi:MAG: hypothetical protein JO337_08785 [Acidimicrobiales bacterium]|nr:hypothetical protein [Acidimicrobiales bacterium]